MSEKTPKAKPTLPLAVYLGLGALSAVAAFAAVYVMVAQPDNEAGAKLAPGGSKPAAEEGSAKTASGRNPLSTGAMTTFVFKKTPEALPDVSFVDGEGESVNLKDLRGKTVLLNLWATWCAPCREEMPALDRLQKELGSDKFEVVALAIDKNGIEGARKFLTDNKVTSLKPYADPTAREGATLKVIGMPTTILIDAEGREIGRLVGPAEWDSEEAKRLISASL